MFFKIWVTSFKFAHYFAPLLGILNLFLFLFVSSNLTVTDNGSYVDSVFDSFLCSFQSSLCRGWAYITNRYIAEIISFSNASFLYYLLQYIVYLTFILASLHIVSRSFTSNLFTSKTISIFRFLLLTPSFIYIFQPGKETFQFCSLCLLVHSLSLLKNRLYFRSITVFLFCSYIAYGSHELFLIPVVLAYLISALSLFLFFSSPQKIRVYSSPRVIFLFTILFVVIASFAIFSIPYISAHLQYYDSYSSQNIASLSTTSYIRLSPQNPFYFLLCFVQFSFLPVPTLSSIPTFLFSTFFFIELVFVISSFSFFFADGRSSTTKPYHDNIYLIICLIITFLLVFSYWSIGTLTWGTAIRHRAPLICLLHVIHFRFYQSVLRTHALKNDP